MDPGASPQPFSRPAYHVRVKEFVIYSVLRLALFAGTLGIVTGVWALLTDNVWLPGALVVAFVLSGLGSLVLLNRPREAFAQRVQVRAERATKAFDEMRAREDAGTETNDPPEPRREP